MNIESPLIRSRKISHGSSNDESTPGAPGASPKISSGRGLLQRRSSTVRASVSASGSTQYTAALAEVKSDDDEPDMAFAETVKATLKNFLQTTTWTGKLYEWFFVIVSVISTIEYMYQTYEVSNPHNTDDKQIYYSHRVELAFALLFGFDWLLNLLIVDHYFNYLFRY
jgi:hypothetical protein